MIDAPTVDTSTFTQKRAHRAERSLFFGTLSGRYTYRDERVELADEEADANVEFVPLRYYPPFQELIRPKG